MTKRQQGVRDFVLKYRDTILSDGALEEFAILPLGTQLTIRLCRGEGWIAVGIRKTPNGYEWREEASWYRKGLTSPSWKPL